MADTPTAADVLSAIKASGYLMEQEVASELETLGFHVQTNRAFEDSDEGKSRELDVAAVRSVLADETHHVAEFVELLCECKNSEQPFVFLLRPRTKADDYRKVEELVLPRAEYRLPIQGKPNMHSVVPAIDHLGIRPLRYQSQQKLKAVQFAKIVRDKGKWAANHAGLYDAIFYPLLKALIARRQEIVSWHHQTTYTWLFFPIVVTSGELFVLDTTDSSAQPQLADYVSFTRHIKSQKIDGYFTIDFVTQSALKAYVAEVVTPMADGIKAIIEKTPELFKKQ